MIPVIAPLDLSNYPHLLSRKEIRTKMDRRRATAGPRSMPPRCRRLPPTVAPRCRTTARKYMENKCNIHQQQFNTSKPLLFPPSAHGTQNSKVQIAPKEIPGRPSLRLSCKSFIVSVASSLVGESSMECTSAKAESRADLAVAMACPMRDGRLVRNTRNPL